LPFLHANDRLLPDAGYWRELRRPWKVSTFGVGLGWLVFGALNYGIGDWDVGVSLLMATLTYCLAPWSVALIGGAARRRNARGLAQVALSVSTAVLVVDTSYVVYHTLVGNPLYREANFYASFPLYYVAGMVWLYRGSLADFLAEFRSAWRRVG
jgi:hypothetical protein